MTFSLGTIASRPLAIVFNDSTSAARQSAYGIVAAATTLVRADATGFGGNGLTADPGVTGSDLRQNNPDTGAQARVVFQVILRAL